MQNESRKNQTNPEQSPFEYHDTGPPSNDSNAISAADIDSLNFNGENNPLPSDDKTLGAENDSGIASKSQNDGDKGSQNRPDSLETEQGLPANADKGLQKPEGTSPNGDFQKPDATSGDLPKTDAPDMKDAAGSNPDVPSSSELGAATSAVTAAPNLNDSIQEASDEGIENNARDVAVETLKAAPRIAADVGTENVPGLVIDAVDYGAKTLPKIIKLSVAAVVVIAVFFLSIFGTIGMLPSILFGGVEEKLEERQVDKAQKAIETFYEERATKIVNLLIQDVKSEGDIFNFTSWKRIVAGKNENYTVSVSRVNETNSLVTVTNVQNKTGIQIVFNNVYLNDFSSVCVDKVSIINAYAYTTCFADDENFKQGKAVDYEKLFATDEATRWRSKDTKGLKDWLDANEQNLVSYSLIPTDTVTQNDITYRCFTCDIESIATFDEVCNAFGVTEDQKQQLSNMSFAGNVYLSACDDVVEEDQKILTKNIYPRLDVYTNLVGGSDNLIWSMLPNDYLHLIAEDESTGTAMLINEILLTAKGEIGYMGTAENSSKYNQFIGTDNLPWSASFISWVMNEVDGKISMTNKLLDNVIPKTTDVNYLAGYLFTHNFTWHYKSDNYSPQVGDIIFLYVPPQTINADGSVTVTDTTPVSELYPSLNVTDANLRVTSAGIVESCSGGTVTFVYGDSANESVERTMLDLSSGVIVAYATPKYEDVAGETLVYAGDVLDKGDFLLPFKGSATVSALFGRYPSGGTHTGLDFACPIGTPVIACNAGTVTKADAVGKTTYGYYIKIVSQTSSGEVSCVYAHLSKLYVKEGEEVASGQVIGLSGNTGNSTGPHIHLAIEQSGIKRNPATYLRDEDKIKLHALLTN